MPTAPGPTRLALRFAVTGATTGAVNFPQIEMPRDKDTVRILNVHRNVPGVLRDVNRIVSEHQANIHSQMLSTDAEIGYLSRLIGEEYASAFGLSYRVQSSAEYHPFYIQNLKLLRDFLIKPFHVEEAQEAQVLESLQAYPGISVQSLLDAHPGLPVDVIWALLIKQCLFIDLSAAVLTSWDQIFLYRHAAEVPRRG